MLYYEEINLPRLYTLSLIKRACDGGVPLACRRYGELRKILEELRHETGLQFSVMSFAEIPLR